MYDNLPLPLRITAAMLAAFLCAAFVTPSVAALAMRVNAVDLPGEARRVNRRAVPRLGGVAILMGFFASALVFLPPRAALGGVMRGALLIALMGFLDDCFSLRPPLKLAVQIVSAVLAWRSGARIEVVTALWGGARYVTLGPLSLPLTVGWLVICTNAMNLIDGLDGLAAGVAVIASLTMLLVAAAVSEGEIAVLLAALAGGCLGFLPYNRNPAKIFMGDVGAQTLGFLLGAAAMLGLFKTHAILTFLVPPLALGLPLGDTAFAFLRRALRRQNPLRPDRGHIHHMLLDLGLGQRKAVTLLYGVSALSGLLAVALTRTGDAARALAALTLSCAGAAACALIRKRMALRRRAS
ncbi:MAG: undecaprenyl/decaprenyl-phosphate alpha-N-acetylglucosaminyl 1-phosphate transferase [Oscillospiraceae bacterium]|nr:undecaprenyl/decaprenyl-phosphate alpha-N-acetylglucosaminyl 1-phosphate transferase [Oscillospiraceae bacterium]